MRLIDAQLQLKGLQNICMNVHSWVFSILLLYDRRNVIIKYIQGV